MPASSANSTRRDRLVLHAPAKVNLHLRVVGRRRDGYHLLESLIAPLSLCDRVDIRRLPGPTISLRCSDAALPQGEDNLAARAALLLKQTSHCRLGAEIRLTKRIPAGAGLGGGSSDAAAVLLGLNQLWQLGLSEERLTSLGLKLGADVPFFVRGRTAVVRGIGERVQPCTAGADYHLVVVWPGFPVATRKVYENLRWSRPARAIASLVPGILAGRLPLEDVVHNDLEAVVLASHPRVRGSERRLEQLGASRVCMTGSGSAVFGVFGSRDSARAAAASLRRSGLWARAVRTLSESPVRSALSTRPRGRIR